MTDTLPPIVDPDQRLIRQAESLAEGCLTGATKEKIRAAIVAYLSACDMTKPTDPKRRAHWCYEAANRKLVLAKIVSKQKRNGFTKTRPRKTPPY